MRFRMISQDEWEVVRYGADSARGIRDRVSRIVNWLGQYFNESEIGGVAGLQFNAISRDDDVVCLVSTPLGSGRIRLGWDVLDSTVYGRFDIDRKAFDQDGVEYWQQVWGLVVPDRGIVFAEQESDGFQLHQLSGNQLNKDIFVLGMCIYYAIAAGPKARIAREN